MALFLRDRSPLGERHIRLLHIAPEVGLQQLIRSFEGVEYVSLDLSSRLADVNADLTSRTPFQDGSFDVILCAHVLEHIDDDLAAIAELRRLTSDDGIVYVVVPQRPAQPTYEDPSITAPQDRQREFGQRDHVRYYGSDLIERLRTAFDVVAIQYQDILAQQDVERMRLQEPGSADGSTASTIHVCTPRFRR